MARSTTLVAIAVASFATACGRAPETVQSPAPPPVPTNPAPTPAPPPPPKPVEAPEPSFEGKPLHEWIAWIDVERVGFSPPDETVAALRAMGAAAIPAVTKRIDDGTPTDDVLANVFTALESIGPAARDTMIGLTKHPRPEVRWGAADGLPDCCAPGGGDVVDALAALLGDDEACTSAAYGLAHIEHPCPRVLDVLVGALEHPDLDVCVRAADALRGSNRVDDATLRGCFESMIVRPKGAHGEGWSAQVAAAQALAKMDGDTLLPSMPVLVAALDDLDDDVGRAAAQALANIGPRAASAAPRMAPIYCRIIDTERPAIVDALRKIGADDVAERLATGDVVPLYVEWLRDSNRAVRFRAADCLDDLGPAAASAIPALLAALDVPGEDGKVRQSVTYALGKVGPGDARVRAALIRSLLDESEYVASAAASGLARGFVQDVDVRDGLLAALASPRCKSPGAVAQALVQYGADAAPALVEALTRDGTDEAWGSIGGALNKIGAPAAAALRVGLASKNADVRGSSLEILSDVTPPPTDMAALARTALDDEAPEVRRSAADVLGRLAEAGAAAAPRLRAALVDKSVLVRAHAAAALWRVTKSPRECVDPLVDALADEELLAHAAEALAEMGAAAAPAAARIAKLLDAPDVAPSHRDAMIDVLAGIGPAARPAVPGLIRSLHGLSWCAEQTYAPMRAIEVLGALGPDARAALPALRDLKRETPSLAPDIDAAIAKIEAKQ